MGISTSRLFDRRAYGGTIEGEYRTRSPSAASRSRTRGWRTATGPMPVMISRCGRWPWRTTRCRPVSVFRSACFARNSATSASTAWVSSARAPLRRISVRESVKAPGWASLITLPSDTAYHSFIGEVEALNTTTIRRLTPSCRHQLLAIAPPEDAKPHPHTGRDCGCDRVYPEPSRSPLSGPFYRVRHVVRGLGETSDLSLARQKRCLQPSNIESDLTCLEHARETIRTSKSKATACSKVLDVRFFHRLRAVSIISRSAPTTLRRRSTSMSTCSACRSCTR